VKRFASLIAVLAWAVALLAACSPGETKSAPIKIRIGTDATFPPFEMVDYNQRTLTGFDIELMQAIAAKSNLEVEFVNTGFENMLRAIAACQTDGAIAAIPITAEHRQQMLFSDPYFVHAQVVVVKQGNLTLTGWEKLPGQTVGVQRGTPGALEVQKLAGAQVKTYPALDLAFEDLINGQIDAVVADQPQALSYVNIRANNLKLAGAEFAREDYGIAVCAQRPDLAKTINRGLAAVKADGTLDQLTQKWLTGSRY
jgi:polar amino acid transport system substrate-binding protein